MFTVIWTPKATRQLTKIQPEKQREAITQATRALETFPDVVNVTALTKHDVGYRLRVGSYRVLFDVVSEVKIISIEEVKKRDERTY